MTDTANASSSAPSAQLHGARVWIVTDGSAEQAGWLRPVREALRGVGAGSVDVLSVSGVLSMTAKGLLEQGADRIARTLRLAPQGQPEQNAVDAHAGARPDLIVADHPAVLRTLEVIRDTTGVGSVHVGLVAAHRDADAWKGARADAFVAPDEATVASLRRSGMSDAALRAAGPPVPAGFERELDRDALREDFGFGEDARVVLIDIAGAPAAELDGIVFQLGLTQSSLVPLLYYGHDHEAADAARRSASVHGVRADMFGHVDAFEEYVRVADLVVAGPTSAHVGAYLCADRPMISWDNALQPTSLAQRGSVVVVSLSALGDVLQHVGAQGVPAEHTEAAKAQVSRTPNRDIARALASIWASRASLRAVLAPAAAPSTAANPSAANLQRSRFESIGAGAQTESLQPLSRAAAKEQLASLILDERRIERDLEQHVAERDTWMERLELAESAGDAELASVAKERVDASSASVRGLNERLEALRRQKERVRQRASAAAPRAAEAPAAPVGADYEARFRQLERKRDLDRLRRKAFDGGDA